MHTLTNTEKRKINARKARGNYIPEDFDHSGSSIEFLEMAISIETDKADRWEENKWGEQGSLITANLEALRRELKKRLS